MYDLVPKMVETKCTRTMYACLSTTNNKQVDIVLAIGA